MKISAEKPKRKYNAYGGYMFGYITVNKPELKVKEFDAYHSYYCGLCKALGREGGQIARLSLSYDMTFIYILLSALYEPRGKEGMESCALHPAKSRLVIHNAIAEYVSDMSILMAYLKGRDDFKDRESLKKSIAGRIRMDILKKSYIRVCGKYPEKTKYIISQMISLDEGEKSGNTDIDYMAGLFGNIMGEVFCIKNDIWEKQLRKMGFFLGKFIYIMDAYEDVKRDEKSNSYNPFADRYRQSDFDEYIKEILIMMMADCTAAFEIMPIIKNAELIRNILYSGVWIKYKKIAERK